MIPPPSTRCLLPPRHAGGSTPPCGSTQRVQRPHGKEGRVRRTRPRHRGGRHRRISIGFAVFRCAVQPAINPMPNPDHPLVRGAGHRGHLLEEVRHFGWVFGMLPAERRGALGPVMPEMAGFRKRAGSRPAPPRYRRRHRPHAAAGGRSCETSAGSGRHPAFPPQPGCMLSTRMSLPSSQSRPRIGQHDLHLFGASSGCTAINRPADRLERGASVDVLLDRAATVANGMSPEAGSPYRPSGV